MVRCLRMPDLRFLALLARARLERLRRDHELVEIAASFRCLRALEIGGPSALFATDGRFPLYAALDRLDATNYASSTLWEDAVSWEGCLRPEHTIIGEAADLSEVDEGSYDAVLCSHVVEHLANPIGALRAWRRVLRPGGRLVLVAPHADGTFDHRRPITSLEHLKADFEAATPESDLTHLDEVLELHDRKRDVAGDWRAFEARARANAVYRTMHHHVFHSGRLLEMVEAAGLVAYRLACRRPYHVILVAGQEPRLAMTQEQRRQALAASPFPRDHALIA